MNKQQKDVNCFKEMREECDKVYISWPWFIGIMIVLFGGAIGVNNKYAKEQNAQDAAITSMGVKTDLIASDIKLIKENNGKLDTLLMLARGRR